MTLVNYLTGMTINVFHLYNQSISEKAKNKFCKNITKQNDNDEFVEPMDKKQKDKEQ